MTDKEWRIECAYMSKLYTGVLGEKIIVKDVEHDELGYTGGNNILYIAREHSIMDGLSENEKRMFRMGVGAHELLHRLLTDFTLREKLIKGYPVHEQRIVALIDNILEDPAIEFFAPQMFGGVMLDALRFTIKHVYRKSPQISESKSPFSQFINALIQFGDMGLVKGQFTFPEARKVFIEAAPVFGAGIEEPIPEKRTECSKKITEISRPLWEKDTEFEKELMELLKQLSRLGSGKKPNGFGKPNSLPEKPDGQSAAQKRRKITIKKISKEEFDEIKENGKANEGPLPDEGDITVFICDEDMDNKQETEGNSSGDAPSEAKDSGASCGFGKDNNDTDKSDECSPNQPASDCNNGEEEAGDEGETNSNRKTDNQAEQDGPVKNHNKDSQNESIPDNARDFGEGTDTIEDGDYEIQEDEYTISEEDIDEVLKGLEEVSMEEKRCENESMENKQQNLDFPVSTPRIKKANCTNIRVRSNNNDSIINTYNCVVTKMASGISSLTSQLKQIFQNDVEEMEHYTSGKVNIKRAFNGKTSSKIFDKRKNPAERDDVAVMILVDESGSMGGKKSEAARNTCIAFAEVFAKLKMPVYIMGFTTGDNGYDAVHYHYLTWLNTKTERIKLLNIKGRNCNFDSYSIRYGYEILKKKNTKHKVMIVISDGTPSAENYCTLCVNGVTDTKDVIREAKKVASVLGVAVGNCDADAIHYIYGNDFIHINNVDELFAKVSKKLKQIIKSWE